MTIIRDITEDLPFTHLVNPSCVVSRMSSSSSSSPAPPRSSRSIITGEGGSSSSSRTPATVTREKITKAWPSLLADDKKDDLHQIVLDHMSGAILYDSFFGHIVNPSSLTIPEERAAFTTYLAECHGYMPVKLVISGMINITSSHQVPPLESLRCLSCYYVQHYQVWKKVV